MSAIRLPKKGGGGVICKKVRAEGRGIFLEPDGGTANNGLMRAPSANISAVVITFYPSGSLKKCIGQEDTPYVPIPYLFVDVKEKVLIAYVYRTLRY